MTSPGSTAYDLGPTEPAIPPASWVGRRLGGTYELRRLLGIGGMAFVYEAVHVRLRRPVAVKVLLPEFSRSASFVERFVFEARAAAGVPHPNVIDVLDLGYDDGIHFMVMELLRGEALSSTMDRRGQMPPRVALPIAIQVLDGLAAAHDVGILHRDLKPENIFLSRRQDGSQIVKLLDFGVARLSGDDPPHGRITEQGLVVGTPAYMSPEQASGEAIDGRSDLYAVGVLLYEMLSGHLPHGPNGPEVLNRIVNDAPRPIARHVHGLSRGLSSVVSRALAREPDHRYGDARALQDALRRLMTEPKSAASAKGPRARRGTSPSTNRTVATRLPR